MIWMAVTDDSIPVFFNELGKLFKGRQFLPAQLCFPVIKEFACPGRIAVIPKLTERLFQKIGFMQPLIGF